MLRGSFHLDPKFQKYGSHAYEIFTLLLLQFIMAKTGFRIFISFQKKKLLKKNEKNKCFFWGKMRSGANQTMVLSFEIERSNSICLERRYRCTSVTIYFFYIPSHFCARNVQSSAIFQSAKLGHVFERQCILQIDTCEKWKKKRVTELRYIIFCKKNTIRSFLSKKNKPKNGPRRTLFNNSAKAWNRPVKFVGVCTCFYETCQKSPNCRKTFSRPAMNSPGIGQQPPGIKN